MNSLVNKLLWRHISAWQMAGFVLASLFGMAIVLSAVQVYSDLRPLFTAPDSFMRGGHLVLTKHVSTVGTLTGQAPAFSQKEVERLRQQPFAQRVAGYTPAQFSVFATVGAGGSRFSTDMFFEAVPDEFLDVDLSHWTYDPDSPDVPIILPRTYLNLYNFGFAGSQGLPTISEELAGAIAVNLRLTGVTTVLKTGHVVAFSRRLNTILVPQAFMDHMNALLAPGSTAQPSRLIVEVDNPADSRIADYLDRYGYDTEATDADASRAAGLLRIIVGIVLLVGLVISILAFYVLLLSIFLLMQKHTEKIDNLLLLGYTPRQVARPFHLLTLLLHVVVLLLALACVVVLRSWYLPRFGGLYGAFQPSAFMPTVITGVALFLLVAVLHYVAVRRKVIAIWHMHE